MPDPNSFAVSTHTVTGSQFNAILNLNNDVLWYIFSINADMKHNPEGETPALLTLRQTSQVCSHWRELSISSSSLWARILNLSFLSQTRPDWREEVIRRTGTAALYIQASNLDFYQHCQWQLRWGVLRKLLNDHWGRFRSLDVNVELFCWEFMENEATWQRLFESSLEILKMKFPSPSAIDNPRSSIFFAPSITPLLHTLSVEYTGLDFSTLRIPSLRNLVIGPPVSVPALLSALRHMPLLEVLQASTLELKPLPGDADTRSVLPKVTLPRLRTLEFHDIDSCIGFVLSFLAQITPAVGCTLDFSGAYYDETADFKQASSVLSAYLQNYTAYSAVTKVDMKLVMRQVIFRLDNSSSGDFSFGLESDFAEEGIAAHFSALSTIELGAIKTLTLSVSQSNACHPDFRNFILSLVSVEYFKTDLRTLDYFQNTLLSSGIIALPAVKTIYVDCQWASHHLMMVVICINRRNELGFRPEKLTLKFVNSAEIDYARVELDLLFPAELIVRYIT